VNVRAMVETVRSAMEEATSAHQGVVPRRPHSGCRNSE